jgi:2-oxoglutarate dehydrogenase E2 component (dihydrolipoamide succinyltransferase)
MGESITEGTITKWLKKPGDAVAKDEPLFEISTDKVDAEIPSPAAGILTAINVEAGATVQINTVVAVIGEAGVAVAAAKAAPASAPAPAAPAVATAGYEVVMPQMGESITEGTITKWLKKPGDAVAKDEPLFEISTDKVDAEIPSPAAGILSSIKVEAGQTVTINTVVAIIGGTEGSVAPAAAAPVQIAAAPVAAAPVTTQATIASGAPLRSSPLVRKIARENNLDLTKIPGTGSEGRITKEDVLRALENPAAASTAAAPAKPAAAKPATTYASLPGELVPMSKMRAIIAHRMVESVATSPHVHTVFKVDMTRIVRLRDKEKGKYEQRNGVRLTFMPFIAAAAVHALRKFPIVNASVEGDAIRYNKSIGLGIAVALDWGLIVPVIKNAEDKSFLGLARSIVDLAERARGKKLLPDEVSGSTFTLTNSGIFGEEFGLPIINQPETAILGIGGLKKEPAVVQDADGNDVLGIRSFQHFALGFDHRSIDGADAGKFMAEFKSFLENWDGDIG